MIFNDEELRLNVVIECPHCIRYTDRGVKRVDGIAKGEIILNEFGSYNSFVLTCDECERDICFEMNIV